jgi:hypothetical protein
VLVIVYVQVHVPTPTPVATPVDEPIVATEVLLLLHVPPGVPSVKVAVEPWHILYEPMMIDGVGLIVRIAVALHPLGPV